MNALLVFIALVSIWTAAPASSQSEWQPGDIEVDVELILAVDVSRSVSPGELEIQRRGYAEAITSPEVLDAIGRGLLGRIAITYVEWAGVGSQRTVIDWTILGTEAQAQEFANRLTSQFNTSMRRTSISDALLVTADLFDGNGYYGMRRVIDVSGDGPNNSGMPIRRARDMVLARGIIINGLPLMTRDGMGSQWHLDDLDVYYRECVIGGPGSFVIPVTGWDQFALAVRRKLILELASAPSGRATPEGAVAPGGDVLILAQYVAPSVYDCLIGEKIWERNRNDWYSP